MERLLHKRSCHHIFFAEEIYSEAGGTNTGMPQGTIKPSDTDRQRLADWLSCGAK